jgi:hypothetical protein
MSGTTASPTPRRLPGAWARLVPAHAYYQLSFEKTAFSSSEDMRRFAAGIPLRVGVVEFNVCDCIL